MKARRSANRDQILKLEHHRGRAFEIGEFCARQGGNQAFGIRAIDIIDENTEALQHFFEKPESIAIDMPDGDDPIAWIDEGENGRGNRAHATGKRPRGLCAFHLGDPVLENLDGWIIAT